MTMASHGAERQASAFKKSVLSVEPGHKMDRQQYQSLLKEMYMPVVRGPENRHGFASFEEKNSNSFLKFNPFTAPIGPNYPLFPHQDDVPLVDPCSGFMNPGADADLQPNVGRAIECLVDYSDVKPHQQIPVTGKRGQSAHRRQMILLEENRVECGTPGLCQLLMSGHDSEESSDPSARWREEKARDYFYKSNTQNGCVGAVNFEDIGNAYVDLIPLNYVRTSKPRYTSTAHAPDIPGYTGKVHWSATHPANSNLPSTAPSIIARLHGYIAKHRSSPQYNHQGPFSQMLTPVSPQNSSNKREQKTITV